MLAASDADLRVVGPSRRKVEYVRDLAQLTPADARERAERRRPQRSLAAIYPWELVARS